MIEHALETAGLMLGSDKSRGYMLEMICADFLAGRTSKPGIQTLWYFLSTGFLDCYYRQNDKNFSAK